MPGPLDALRKATSIGADPNPPRKPGTASKALEALTGYPSDPSAEIGPVDVMAAGIPFLGSLKGVLRSGASSTVKDLYGIEPEITRREFFDRLTGRPKSRSIKYLEESAPQVEEAYNTQLANAGLMEKVPAYQSGTIVHMTPDNRSFSSPIKSTWKATPKWDEGIDKMLKEGTPDPFEHVQIAAEKSALEGVPNANNILDKYGLILNSRLGWVYPQEPRPGSIEDTTNAVSGLVNYLKSRFGVK